MSSSVHKDTFNVIMMHKLPPHLSMDEWVAKRESLVNEALSLPVVQKNLVKCEIIIQNELFDDHFKVFGLPKRDPVLFVALRSETAEQLYAILADAEVRRIFERGKEAGSQSYGFSVDIVAKINKQALSNGVNTFFVYNVPPQVSSAQHDKKYDDWIDHVMRVPVALKNFVGYELFKSNNVLDEHTRAFGYTVAQPMFISRGLSENWDAVTEMVNDSAFQTSILEAGNAGKDFDLKKYAYMFSADVVTKLDKYA